MNKKTFELLSKEDQYQLCTSMIDLCTQEVEKLNCPSDTNFENDDWLLATALRCVIRIHSRKRNKILQELDL